MIKKACIILAMVFYATSKFIEPFQRYPRAEAFRYNDEYEFIISNFTVRWNRANVICHSNFGGWLATLETTDYKLFTVEAMSESSMNLDGLWVALKKDHGFFYWSDSNTTVPENELIMCTNNSISVESEKPTCVVLVRANHTGPCFASLNCDALRGFVCKRNISDRNPSTHLGWIRIGERLYKIFSPMLSYDDAEKACTKYDRDAHLAVVTTVDDAKFLARYILIGRPSLEKVWIGARWKKSHYEFESESIILSNISNSSQYPPWRNGTMSYPNGCLLLDRHLKNTTYFVESACHRLQSYMCYKVIEEITHIDVCNIGDYDWRIYYEKLNWFEASSVCIKSSPSGRLAVVEKKDLKYFIYIMESSLMYLVHSWLGAYYNDRVWTWSYTNLSVPSQSENGYPPWIVNATYNEEVEQFNLCLNIDRENNIVPLFYGTICSYPQTFVCQYDKGTICSKFPDTTTTTPGTEYSTSTTESTTNTAYTTKSTPMTKSTTKITSTSKSTTKSTPTTVTTTTALTTTPTTTSSTSPTTTRTTTLITIPTTTPPSTIKTTTPTPIITTTKSTTTKRTTRTTPKTTTRTRTTPTRTTPKETTRTRTTTRRTTTKRTTTKRTTTKRTTTKRTTTKRTTTKRTTTKRTTTKRTTTKRTTTKRTTTKRTTTKRTTTKRSTTKRRTTTEGWEYSTSTTEWFGRIPGMHASIIISTEDNTVNMSTKTTSLPGTQYTSLGT